MEITVTIEVEDILADVLDVTHRTGQAFQAGNGSAYEAAANMIADLDDQDAVALKRSIDNAAGRIRTEFGEFLQGGSAEVDNRIAANIIDSGQIAYIFRVPANFDTSAVDALPAAIHEYITASTLANWFNVSNPGAVPLYTSIMASTLANAKRVLYKRTRPIRPEHYAGREEESSGSNFQDSGEVINPNNPIIGGEEAV